MSWIRPIAFVMATLAVSVVDAQQSTPLTFIDAARKTLASHPQLERFSLALEAGQARVAAAALRAPLEVAAAFENVAGHDALEGIDAAEITVSLTSLWERGNKRDLRIGLAQRTVELLSTEQRVEMLDLLSETGRRFVATAAAQEGLLRARERAAQAQATLDLIVPRVSTARSPRTEQLNAEVELAAAKLAAGNAERDLEAARFALAAQWAAPQETPVVSVDLYAVPEPRPFEVLARELERLPDLERFAAEGRVREAELRSARAQAVADWRWSAGVRRLEAIDEQALVLSVSVPIGARRRGESFVREAELQQSQAPISANVRRLQLLTLLHEQWEQLRSTRAATQSITDEQLPRAREALELTQRGYEIGRFPYRELLLIQQQVLQLEAQRLAAAAQYHLTRIEIERLTGAQLTLLEGRKP